MPDENLPKRVRLTILIGEFGSGKTEFAINYALWLQNQGSKTAIIDMDLIKPYFRTRESRNLLEKAKVTVIAPEEKYAQSDLPIMPTELTRYLYDENFHVVIDAGGGNSAIVLGQLHQQIIAQPHEVLMVINSRRPFTQTPAEIIGTLRNIEQITRLKVSGLVLNTNLSRETAVDHIDEGIRIINYVSRMIELPIRWVVVPEWLEGKVNTQHPIFILKPYIKYPWMG